VSGGGSIDDVVVAMREQLAAIRSHEPGVRKGHDPEELHQMRTAVRRLRAVLRLLRDVLENDVEPGRAELRWLGHLLGAVRDADVQGDYFQAVRTGFGGCEAAIIDRVRRRLDVRRERARGRLLAALDSPRYAALVDALTQALRDPRFVDENLHLKRLARKPFTKLRRAVAELPGRPSDEEIHEVRIKLRRARYAAELAEATHKRRAKRFVKRADTLQDVLGQHQDAVVAERALQAVRRATHASDDRAAAGRLIERERRRRRAAWRKFEDKWPRLERRGRKAWG
jgi:CHAD domain-containing protein